ncbi:MAG: dihydrolipoyl dehydrogenase [Clostridia bacterium]|nr:dihydrolipoyl dehydrogenase [Clostridia bacterium]
MPDKKTDERRFDLLVIGGGPGGYSAAIAAAKAGLSVALFERESLGGTCLNVGCIPTKYLLDKAATMEKVRALTEGGVFREAGSFSFKKIQEGKSAAVKRLTGGVAQLLKANDVAVINGEARLLPGIKAECAGEEYRGKNAIIATGSAPVRIPIPGAEHALDSTAALALGKVPPRFAVIGGGVIGLELASAYASFGSEVTVIELMDALLPNELPQAAKQLTRALAKRGIKIETSAAVQSIEKQGAELRVRYEKAASKNGAEGKMQYTDADAVLMGVGRRASLAGIDAVALGLALNRDGSVKTDARMRTSAEGIYAVGDAAGGYQLAHAAYAEAEAAVADILGRGYDVDFSVLPRCVYTMPCFAAVGITEADAQKRGIRTAIGSFPYEANGMALAEGASGTVYSIMDANSKATIGVQIVGENAAELIGFASLAVKNAMTAAEWERTIVAHPSLSEMLKEAALDSFKLAIHKL